MVLYIRKTDTKDFNIVCLHYTYICVCMGPFQDASKIEYHISPSSQPCMQICWCNRRPMWKWKQICSKFISFCECCRHHIVQPVGCIIISLVEPCESASKLCQWAHVNNVITTIIVVDHRHHNRFLHSHWHHHRHHCLLMTAVAEVWCGISDVCPECGVTPHSVEHLFNCQSHPTQLTVQDLWDNPAAVADFLNLDNWR